MQSESVKELAAALAAAQAEMPSVPMNSVNPFLKNKFADLGAVINTSRPVLAKHGLSLTQFPISDGDRVGVTTTLMHSSGEWMSQSVSLPLSEEKGKSAAQVAGSIVTYLRRYSWSSVLGLYADEDTDGHQPAKPEQTEKVSPKKELSEPEKKKWVMDHWEKLLPRAKAVKIELPAMDGGWTSADMKKHYEEQLGFVKQAEKQAEAV